MASSFLNSPGALWQGRGWIAAVAPVEGPQVRAGIRDRAAGARAAACGRPWSRRPGRPSYQQAAPCSQQASSGATPYQLQHSPTRPGRRAARPGIARWWGAGPLPDTATCRAFSGAAGAGGVGV